jgi:hypothetical protein
VQIHEDYHDLEPWTGKDVDIIYYDKDGIFTGLLVGNGYLDSIWIGAQPTYWLEVKTTTRECSAPFFLSRNEYQLVSVVRQKVP